MWGHIFDLQNPLVGADNTWVLWAICATGAAIYTFPEILHHLDDFNIGAAVFGPFQRR